LTISFPHFKRQFRPFLEETVKEETVNGRLECSAQHILLRELQRTCSRQASDEALAMAGSSRFGDYFLWVVARLVYSVFLF
jgi:hypothetical protein